MAQTQTEPITRDTTLANGLGMRYYEWPGTGPNLVLLHPSSGYGRMWDMTAGLVGGHFHVFALDQRGHGIRTDQTVATQQRNTRRTCICFWKQPVSAEPS